MTGYAGCGHIVAVVLKTEPVVAGPNVQSGQVNIGRPPAADVVYHEGGQHVMEPAVCDANVPVAAFSMTAQINRYGALPVDAPVSAGVLEDQAIDRDVLAIGELQDRSRTCRRRTPQQCLVAEYAQSADTSEPNQLSAGDVLQLVGSARQEDLAAALLRGHTNRSHDRGTIVLDAVALRTEFSNRYKWTRHTHGGAAQARRSDPRA